MRSFANYLTEIDVSPNKGAKYGQVIFLVGGAASGKSTATKKFINTANYKILNPDDVKDLIVKAGKKDIPFFSSMKDIDPDSPKGSQQVHAFMRSTKVSSKKSRTMMRAMQKGKETLPNLLFDRTFAFSGEFKKISRGLIKAGYKAENIHVVFVFTDINIALKRNRERTRTLPDDIIVSTAQGAKARFVELFFGKAKGAVANGDWHIIIDRGKEAIQVKEAGKRVDRAGEVAKKVASLLGKR